MASSAPGSQVCRLANSGSCEPRAPAHCREGAADPERGSDRPEDVERAGLNRHLQNCGVTVRISTCRCRFRPWFERVKPHSQDR